MDREPPQAEVGMNDITRILAALEEGDSRAVDRLLPAVYQELRQLAAQKLSREPRGQTLQPTALVHEAYLRLVGAEEQSWWSRTQFFAAAAEAMRRILIENARRKRRLKRGGCQERAALDDDVLAIEEPSEDLIALNEALTRLAEKEPAVVELVKLRYFAGLTIEQAAEVLGVSQRTANRYWAYARAWLFDEVTQNQNRESR
jgi:RNA polymerase sigma factor (TIGR02999 family)